MKEISFESIGSVRVHGDFNDCSDSGDNLAVPSTAKTTSFKATISKGIRKRTMVLEILPSQLFNFAIIGSFIGIFLMFTLLWFIPEQLGKPKSKKEEYIHFLETILIMLPIFFLFFYALFYIVQNNLIDYTLFVTLVLAEVPIAVFLHYILGERGRSRAQKTNDAIMKTQAISNFKHLEACGVIDNHFYTHDYPLLKYYIVNKHTKLAFWAPDEIRIMEENNVIFGRPFAKQEELDEYFKKEEITIVPRKPLAGELDP